MTPTGGTTVFRLDRSFDGRLFKTIVTDVGYTDTALAETVGISCAHERQDTEVVLRRVATDRPYDLLVRLFWLGRAVEERALRRALPHLDVEALIDLGLLSRGNGEILANAGLGPYHELLLASDIAAGRGGKMAADHVLGVGAASLTLANITVRREVGTALDLGTGAGIQAFLASRHSRRVLGTDTNPRALNFAAFNARLNGIDNVEWCQGSLCEPVADRQFDLIVSNPPFVISPESRFIFRDADMRGDAISEKVVRDAAERLTEGGFACLLLNWYHEGPDDWDHRPADWVRQTGCDGWLICFKSADSLTYAADWLKMTLGHDSAAYGQSLDEWVRYYDALGARRISAGALVMRRRSHGRPWFRSHNMDRGKSTGPCGRQIERIFAAEDYLQGIDDDKQLLRTCFRLDKHHRLEHSLSVQDGRWGLDTQYLQTTEGIPFGGSVDLFIANLLARCDGQRPLGDLITETAVRLGADAGTLVSGCPTVIRKLLQSGFLHPVGGASESP